MLRSGRVRVHRESRAHIGVAEGVGDQANNSTALFLGTAAASLDVLALRSEFEDGNQRAEQGEHSERAHTNGPRPTSITFDSPHPWPQLSRTSTLENLVDLLGEFGRRWCRAQFDKVVGEQPGTNADRRQFRHRAIDVLVQSSTL